MTKLTDAQRRALQQCAEAGRLRQSRNSLWRWNRTFPNGMVTAVAANPTIYSLVRNHGMLKFSDNNSVVELTEKGHTAITAGQRDE